MALATRHSVNRVTTARRTRTSRPSRPLVVAPRAFLQDLIRVFTPSTYQNDKVGSSGTGSNFSGKIRHGERKPFADNFVKGGDKKAAATAQEAAAEQQEQAEQEPGYLDGAVRRVINNNFTSDGPEVSTGNSGWSGDIHTRKEDGFHTKKF